MPASILKPRFVAPVAFAAALAVAVPAAWALGWTNVGAAGTRLNDVGQSVSTSGPVFSSELRLFVTSHSDCGGSNYFLEYLKPDGTLFAQSGLREICFAGESPSLWSVAGGNKYAVCAEQSNEPDDPTSTCQRDSTT